MKKYIPLLFMVCIINTASVMCAEFSESVFRIKSKIRMLMINEKKELMLMEGYTIGTAFCISLPGDKKNLLMTACHNLVYTEPLLNVPVDVESTEIEIPQAKGPPIWLPIKVVKKDVKLDIAIIKTEEPVGKMLSFSTKEPEKKDKLVISGAIRGEPIQEFKAKMDEKFWNGDINSRMETSSFGQGMSGGPVLLNGKVVGIIVAGIRLNGDAGLNPKIGLFAPISVINTFLKDRD